jgi:hypothetical protein
MPSDLGGTCGCHRQNPQIWSVRLIRCLFKGNREHRHPAGFRQERTVKPRPAESGKGSGIIIGCSMHFLTEALITF